MYQVTGRTLPHHCPIYCLVTTELGSNTLQLYLIAIKYNFLSICNAMYLKDLNTNVFAMHSITINNSNCRHVNYLWIYQPIHQGNYWSQQKCQD